MPTITNHRTNHRFTTQPGESVIDAALRTQHLLPYGCRNGACGACKATIIQGKIDYGKYDPATLTQDEIAAGKALLCQATPLTDLTIDAPELPAGQNLQIKTLPCRIKTLQKLAPDVIRLYLQLPKTQTFNYLPGQYIDILLKDGQRRSFSIANLPAQSTDEGIELHIRNVPNGHFTPKVFTALRERDLLRFEGPFGTYILQTEPTHPIIMVAGGTGFSPIKSLIQQALARNPAHHIHLFWGARDQQDLYLHNLPQQWTRDHPNFTYTPVLSDLPPDQKTPTTWQGARGWVHQAVLQTYQDLSQTDLYASGPPPMIEALRTAATPLGLRPDHFYFDSFTYGAETPS